MSAKAQLVSLVDTVASIAKESEPSAAERSRALDAIKVLLDTKVTLQLLKETQAGKTLKKVAKCKDKEIAKQAGEVVEKWMDVIRSAVAKDDSLRKQDANTPSSSQREASAREATTGSKAVTFESTGNSKRDKVREKLVEALMSQEADPEAVKRAAESIEEAMFVQVCAHSKLR